MIEVLIYYKIFIVLNIYTDNIKFNNDLLKPLMQKIASTF